VRAFNNYVKDGVAPVPRREGTSQFKGVSWDKGRGKWAAMCKGKRVGLHATEVAAARAFNTEAERIGLDDVNVIAPAGDVDNGNAAAPAALALLSMAAHAHTHAGGGGGRGGRGGGSGGGGSSVVPPAALALLSMAASAHTHAGAGSKRASPPTTLAPRQTKKIRLDTSAGAAAGWERLGAAAARGQH